MFEELWGEIPVRPRNSDSTDGPRSLTGLGKAERDELCKLPQIPVLEGPKLYQPQPEATKIKREYPVDPLVENNIRLLQYKRQLFGLLEILAQHKVEVSQAAQGEHIPPPPLHQAPPFPQLLPVKNSMKNFNFLSSLAKEDRADKTPSDIPEISRRQQLALLRKSAIKISAHAGYTNAMDSAVTLLSEAAEMFIQNVGRKLRSELDRNLETNRDGNGWADILEKVLVESGSGGILQLQEYYDNNVIKYNSRLLVQCRELEEKYKKEMNACLETGTDNIPEMHFPSSDESLPNLATPTLDVGMQMLQSLEAGVDLVEEPPLSNQSEMAMSNQSCPTPSPALTPRNLCPTLSPALTPRPLHAPSPQLVSVAAVVGGPGSAAVAAAAAAASGGGGSAKKRRRSGGGGPGGKFL